MWLIVKGLIVFQISMLHNWLTIPLGLIAIWLILWGFTE